MELLNSIWAEAQLYVLLFGVFTLFGVLSRGRAALKWSWKYVQSGFASLGMVYFNLLAGGMFFIGYIGLDYVYGALNIPTLPREWWDVLPTPITWVLLLLVYDICLYWVHRWLHGGWRWPMHAVHHSDEELNFLSWGRGHPIEQSFIAGAVLLGSTWLGLSIGEVAFLGLTKALHQHYVHSNIDWDHGPFRKIIASPQYHRWHHADEREAWDKNFASIFPFLDVIWGTYYYPHSAVDVPTGFEGTPRNDLVKLILYPFQEWIRMYKARSEKPINVETQKSALDGLG